MVSRRDGSRHWCGGTGEECTLRAVLGDALAGLVWSKVRCLCERVVRVGESDWSRRSVAAVVGCTDSGGGEFVCE